MLTDRRPGIDFAYKCYRRNDKWFLKVTTTQAEKTNFLVGTECALVQTVVESQFKYALITSHTRVAITFVIGVCKKFERTQQQNIKRRDLQSSLRSTIAKVVFDQGITDDVESLALMVDVVADTVLAKYNVSPK
jgi:quinolinate synthase